MAKDLTRKERNEFKNLLENSLEDISFYSSSLSMEIEDGSFKYPKGRKLKEIAEKVYELRNELINIYSGEV